MISSLFRWLCQVFVTNVFFIQLLHHSSIILCQLLSKKHAYNVEVTTEPWTTGINFINRLQTWTWLHFQKYVINCTWVLNVSQMRGVHVSFRLCFLHPRICLVIKNVALSYPDMFITYCLCLLSIHFPVKIWGSLWLCSLNCWFIQMIDLMLFEKTKVFPTRIQWNTLILDFFI